MFAGTYGSLTPPSLVWEDKHVRIINPNTAVRKEISSFCRENSAVLRGHEPAMTGKQAQNGVTAAGWLRWPLVASWLVSAIVRPAGPGR